MKRFGVLLEVNRAHPNTMPRGEDDPVISQLFTSRVRGLGADVIEQWSPKSLLWMSPEVTDPLVALLQLGKIRITLFDHREPFSTRFWQISAARKFVNTFLVSHWERAEVRF